VSQLALYRKYRSQTFSDLVGQQHVVKTLQNAIAGGKHAHAFLFTGPRGTGKTSTARLVAKALNCEKGPAAEPCNVCASCIEITGGNSMDVLEMDAASESGVDDVREAIVQASEYQPANSRFRVFIIDEVHDLSNKAFDALLKTIEEPPEHVVFILATTEYNKVPPTIRSRCQRFEFHRGSVQDVADRLAYVAKEEKIECEPAALVAIARMADGGFRDALTLLDQAILTADGKVTLELVYGQLGLIADETADALLTAMAEAKVEEIVNKLDEIYRSGRDPRSILESLLMRLSDLTRAAYGIEVGSLHDSALEAGLTSTASMLGKERILAFRSQLAEAHREVRDVSLPRVWVEAELLRIATQRSATAAPREVAPTGESERPREPRQQSAPTSPATPRGGERPREPRQQSAPATKPAETPAPQPSGDADRDKLAAAWHKVVNELSAMSNVASQRLPKSRIRERMPSGFVVVEFERQTDADWVQEGVKIRKAVQEAWYKHSGEQKELKFEAQKSNGARPQTIETTTVELPAEGETLEKLGREVFGTGAETGER
jgi:DNA polymerase-3 subunit gamma/tau